MASLHFDHYDGDGLLMVVGCAELIIGFSFFCLRLWSTRIAFRESKASAQKSLLVSVLLSIAVIFALASSGTLLYLARQHIGGNDPEKNLTTVRLQWTNFCLAVLCTAFIRVSNVASLLQMQRQRKAIAPWWLKGMGVAPGLIESAVIITIVVMLTHICDSADDFTPLSPYTRSSCRMAGVLLIALMVQGALSFIIDFLFGLYTWYLFRKMKLSRSRRIELLPFLLGGFV
ncbi:hypothetical protein ANO11243_027490 [Dothideomycetidae sp. 11243]|nr:hypothetical protein ANO11243_027490 [fungal sp. No.11243]